jgi:DNA-binding NarL/FixJ family response regulator
VAIADADTLLREGLKWIFASESDLLVVGDAPSELDVLEVVKRTKPDVLLLDLHLPKKGALPILLLLNEERTSTKAIILSLLPEKERLFDTAKAGACGYVLKSASSPVTLMQAIKRVHLGEIWVDKHSCAETFVELARQTQNRHAGGFSDTFGALSDREFEILGLVGKGLSNAVISKRLFISLRTVKVHLYKIYQKLHVENRTQAALLMLNSYRQQAAVDLTPGRETTSELALKRKVLRARVGRNPKTRRPSFEH